MHTSLMAIILMSIVIPASETVPEPSESYHVSETIRVLTPSVFECKISGYNPASVRFRVYLPGLEMQEADQPSKELLAEKLKSAKQIELRNAIFRSYFRVEADLWLDGQPFCQRRKPQSIQIEKQLLKTYPSTTALRWHQPQPFSDETRLAAPRSVSIDTLLNTPIDCSVLNEDMLLSEALNLLSESVEPRLPLLIQWKDLQMNALIEKDTPIGVEGFGRMKLRQALNAVLGSAAGREPKPAMIAEGGILILASQETLQKYRITKVYDVRDLLSVPSTGGLYQQGGSSYRQSGLGNIVGNFSR